MSPTTPPPVATDTEPDGAAAYRLGNAALILIWAAGLAALVCGVVIDSTVLRWVIIYVVGAPLIARVGLSLIRAIRRKMPRSDAAAIADGSVHQDERQRYLNAKAGALAGAVALTFPVVSGIFLTSVASLAGVTITTSDQWTSLGFAAAYGSLLTHTIAMVIAARHYSRKG